MIIDAVCISIREKRCCLATNLKMGDLTDLFESRGIGKWHKCSKVGDVTASTVSFHSADYFYIVSLLCVGS